MIGAIQNNPYRFFGLPSNATSKELLANTSRIKSFCNVGKQVDFPLDMNAFLPEMKRSMELIETVHNSLSLPEDRIRHALFWFMNVTSVDAEALDSLSKGDLEQALLVLWRERNYSSAINRGVVYLIKDDLDSAMKCYLSAIHDEEYRSSFVHSVCGANVVVSEEKLSLMLTEELCKEIPLYDLFRSLQKCNAEFEKNHIGGIISTYAENELNDMLRKGKTGGSINMDYYINFLERAYPYLTAVSEVSGEDSFNYQSVSTKVESFVLNGIIEIINGHRFISEYLKQEIIKADQIMRCLKNMKIDQVARQRLEDQSNRLLQLAIKADVPIYNLAPKLFDFKTESEFFQGCKTVRDFKRYLGRFPNGIYKRQAQKLVDDRRRELLVQCDKMDKSLRKTRDLCEQEGLLDEFDDKCFSLCATKSDYKVYMSLLGDKARHRAEAEKHLKFETKVRKIWDYVKKHKIWSIVIAALLLVVLLTGIVWGIGGYSILLKVFMWVSLVLAFCVMETNSSDKTGCLLLLLFGAIAGLCYWGSTSLGKIADERKALLEEQRTMELRMEDLRAHPSVDECIGFLRDYPKSSYQDEVLDLYYDFAEASDIHSLYHLGENYSSTQQGERAMARVKDYCDSLYKEAKNSDNIEVWKSYQYAVPKDFYFDSQTKIDSLVNLKWNTETKAWKSASEENKKSSYEKYLEMYPKGKHKSQAEKRIIDLEVNEIYESGYSSLPSLSQASFGSGPTSTVSINNNTGRTITILYSGKATSKRIVMTPSEKKNVTFPNGTYRVTVTSPGIGNYAGTEHLAGGAYNVEYYISTSKFKW